MGEWSSGWVLKHGEDRLTFVTDLVPPEVACLASSSGRIGRTAVWISREMVDFLECRRRLEVEDLGAGVGLGRFGDGADDTSVDGVLVGTVLTVGQGIPKDEDERKGLLVMVNSGIGQRG